MDTAPSNVPLLVFDGDCSFCRIWIELWKRLTGGQVEYAPHQEVAGRFPEVPAEDFKRAVQLILPDGEVMSAAHAVFRSLAYVPGYAWMLAVYQNVPGFAAAAEWFYRRVAANRSFFYHVTVLLWGKQVEPASYEIAARWFLRCLGTIYLIAFASLGVQITGLVGERGILPAASFLNAIRQNYGGTPWWGLPTLFWLNASDAILKLACVTGAITAVVVVVGFARRWALAIAFVLYLSLVHIGQTFLAYQWDYLLLEAGFLAIFLVPTLPRIWLFRWLLFRLMFLSGTAKLLSGDPTWRNLTALQYHYETQPLPTRFAWYFHQFPPDFQKLSAVFMFFVELLIPFLLFAPRRIRFFAATMTVVFEILIFITGNYTFFNLLAIALCVLLFDDAALRRFARTRETRRQVTRLHRGVTAGIVAFVMLVSGFQLMEIFTGTMPQPVAYALGWIAPLGAVNTYGLFAVMTTSRSEIIVEGSNDGQAWLAYDFKYKPGDLKRPPGWVQPHQPRLDWQMWFAALGNYQGNRWFVNFMLQLLDGSPEVLALLARNPFPSAPPKYIRAEVYDYTFTSYAERRATGAWWRRELKGEYFPVVSLKQTGLVP